MSSLLFIVCGLRLEWVSLVTDWFKSWVPDSVFSAGGGRGSVEAWYTSSLEIEGFLLSNFTFVRSSGYFGEPLVQTATPQVAPNCLINCLPSWN